MRRITSAGVALIGLPLLALTACGGGSSSSTASGSSAPTSAAAGGTLVVWADNSANTAKAIEPLCQQWAQANGVTCEVKKFNGGGELDDALVKAAQTGDVPDIYEAAHNGLGKYLANGIVAPIDLGANKSQFSDVAVQAVTAKGNTYGVPWAVENVAMLTNKSLSPTCPDTLDTAVDNAKKLVAEGKATKGFGISMQIGTTGDVYHWYPLYSADGGYVYKQGSDGTWDINDLGVGKEGSVAAGKRLQSLVKDGVLSASATYDIARETFGKGKSPYFITGPWQIPEQEKALGDNLMVCPVPDWKGSSYQSQPFLGVRVFFQTAAAKNPVLASTFLNDAVMTTDFMDGMYKVDPRPPAWKASFEKAASDPYVKAFGEYGLKGFPMPAIPEMDNVWEDLGLAEAKIAGGADVTSTLDTAAASINKRNGVG